MLAPKTNSEPRNLNFSLQKFQQTARFELNSITSFQADSIQACRFEYSRTIINRLEQLKQTPLLTKKDTYVHCVLSCSSQLSPQYTI